MIDVRSSLAPRAPLENLLAGKRDGDGIGIRARDTLSLATVLVRRGKNAELAERVRQRFGIDLPNGALHTTAGDLGLIGTGPDAWLATREESGADLIRALRNGIGDLASISDQSGAYTVLRLSGLKLRDTLAKMIPIDLHPRVFPPGTVAVTVAGHIGVILWRLDDTAAGSAEFDIAVYRSYATDFWHFLSDSAAEFGLVA